MVIGTWGDPPGDSSRSSGNSTPVEHERAEHFGRGRQRAQVEPFIRGVPIGPRRPIAPGRNSLEVVVAHVVDAGARLQLHRRAENPLVPLVQELHRWFVHRDGRASALKTIPDDMWRMLGEPRIAGDRSGNCGLDLAPGLLDALTRIAAQSAVQLTGAGHRARPVTAVDHADVEVDRMLDIGEGRVRLLVQPRVQLLQRQHDRDRLW